MMGIDELMDLTMYSSMYLLFYMAYFYVEGANLLVPCRVNANFKRILSRFASFFRGFIGAGGWRASAALCSFCVPVFCLAWKSKKGSEKQQPYRKRCLMGPLLSISCGGGARTSCLPLAFECARGSFSDSEKRRRRASFFDESLESEL